MTRLDTDLYYDGGNLPGELTERQWDAQERQKQRDINSACLNEAILCVIQARQTMAEIRLFGQADYRLIEAGESLANAENWIRKAGGKE